MNKTKQNFVSPLLFSALPKSRSTNFIYEFLSPPHPRLLAISYFLLNRLTTGFFFFQDPQFSTIFLRFFSECVRSRTLSSEELSSGFTSSRRLFSEPLHLSQRPFTLLFKLFSGTKFLNSPSMSPEFSSVSMFPIRIMQSSRCSICMSFFHKSKLKLLVIRRLLLINAV